MGLAKEDMMICENRGYGHCDKKVCRDCIGDKHLKAFITANGYMSTCDYCGRRRKVVTVEDLLAPIMSGIRFEYEKADDYYFDGEYMVETLDAYDMVHDILAIEAEIENENLLHDISSTLNDDLWCERNVLHGKDHENYLVSWHNFCKLVKEKMRYVFFRSNEESKEPDIPSPSMILDLLATNIECLGLMQTKPEKTQIFRGRTHPEGKELRESKEFGPPPENKASANRMSPEGIPMFYAAFEVETALDEICDEQPCATVARFLTSRALRLVDLSRLNRIKTPSLFDEDKRVLRQWVLFLKDFAAEISSKADGNPAIDYIPTQIITEFFRYVFKPLDNTTLDGIVYSSAAREGGHCVVLFMDNRDYENEEKCMVNKEKISLRLFKKVYEESSVHEL
ncbi:MAG: RES domain-containing protein [Clostridia bacterium]|nr:RES domain-containing protein [Clostridia bacterium]